MTQHSILRDARDVADTREGMRRSRLRLLAVGLSVPLLYLWWRILSGHGVDVTRLSLPTIDPFLLIVGVFFLVLIGTLLGTTVVAGRSPHVTYRPEQITTRLETSAASTASRPRSCGR